MINKENIPFENYLPCDGKVFTVNGIKYKIRAKLCSAIYPYRHDYVDLCAEYREKVDSILLSSQLWFIDLKKSDSRLCEKLFAKMQKMIDGEK